MSEMIKYKQTDKILIFILPKGCWCEVSGVYVILCCGEVVLQVHQTKDASEAVHMFFSH